ncbi:hypothetical protein [Anaerosporobacter sp.]|uniref:hypothetical protein n=1 Tax=Anaerosporobacter sp. TaxID=1872529 RepID=UPI00286F842E|nr:hypothetical protein [Anaerosporobacter sp.]
MMKLKKVAFAVAMMVTVGSVATPVAQAASCNTKAGCTTQATNNNCTFSSGKLCYTITGNNTCTVTGLSDSGENATSCTIPSTVTCNGKTYKVKNVASNAFKNCNNLNSVNCNKAVKALSSNCFGNAKVKICK